MSFFKGILYTFRKEIGQDGAVQTTRAVDNVGCFPDCRNSFRGGCGLGVKPDFGNGVTGHGLAVKFVFADIFHTHGCREADMSRFQGDGDGCSLKLGAQQTFKMILNLKKVVLIFFQEGVVDGISQVAVTAIGKTGQVGEGSNGLDVILGRRGKREESTQKIADGNYPVAFVGADDTGFTSGVGRSGDGGNTGKTCQDERADDGRTSCTTTQGYYFQVGFHAGRLKTGVKRNLLNFIQLNI